MSSIDPNRNMVCAAVALPRLGTIYSEVKGPPERIVEMGLHDGLFKVNLEMAIFRFDLQNEVSVCV